MIYTLYVLFCQQKVIKESHLFFSCKQVLAYDSKGDWWEILCSLNIHAPYPTPTVIMCFKSLRKKVSFICFSTATQLLGRVTGANSACGMLALTPLSWIRFWFNSKLSAFNNVQGVYARFQYCDFPSALSWMSAMAMSPLSGLSRDGRQAFEVVFYSFSVKGARAHVCVCVCVCVYFSNHRK